MTGETPMSNIIQQGQGDAGRFLHAVLPIVEQNVTHILARVGDKAFLHKVLATGEVLSTELNVPMMREILAAFDSLTQ